MRDGVIITLIFLYLANSVAIHLQTRNSQPDNHAGILETKYLKCKKVSNSEILCNNNQTYAEKALDEIYSTEFWIHLLIVIALVLFAGGRKFFFEYSSNEHFDLWLVFNILYYATSSMI